MVAFCVRSKILQFHISVRATRSPPYRRLSRSRQCTERNREQTEMNKTHQCEWVSVGMNMLNKQHITRHCFERRVTTDKREMNLSKYWFKNKTNDKLFSCKLIADFSITTNPPQKKRRTQRKAKRSASFFELERMHERVWNGRRNTNKYSSEIM